MRGWILHVIPPEKTSLAFEEARCGPACNGPSDKVSPFLLKDAIYSCHKSYLSSNPRYSGRAQRRVSERGENVDGDSPGWR
ncbi:hypothetical protein ARTHRO8AJ_370180 [Arthrobacter sp. 8AJ]|nr:hypothetical protein ARTHRO8AJ_370180 [Arthrobacter sp. 8AJ]